MANGGVEVVGIGNAIVDVLTHADDALLEREGLTKGSMRLIDAAEADALYARLGPGVEISGGSAANTMAGLASLGGRGAFIGKVRDDRLGQVFRHDMRAVGVAFDSRMATDGPATARSLIVVTPDARRTMNTYLGACVELGPEDIDPELVGGARITYLEGYLWDPPRAQAAFVKAAEIAHAAGAKVALTLSDPFCVDRHRDSFEELVARHVDILFANQEELMSLYQSADFDAALHAVRGACDIAVLTRSERGSIVLHGNDVHIVDAEPVAQVVDTTGAGDQYAAGFLYGLIRDYDLYSCGRIASIAAAEVIGHVGARPETSLAALVEARLE